MSFMVFTKKEDSPAATSEGFNEDDHSPIRYRTSSDADINPNFPPKRGLLLNVPLIEAASYALTGQALTNYISSGGTFSSLFETYKGVECCHFNESSESYITISDTLTAKTISFWAAWTSSQPNDFTVPFQYNKNLLTVHYAQIGSGSNYVSGYGDGEWHLIVATIDDTIFKLYIDGALVLTVTSYSEESDSRYCIGGFYSGANRLFRGYIARVRAYDRILSLNAIKRLMKEVTPTRTVLVTTPVSVAGTVNTALSGTQLSASAFGGATVTFSTADTLPAGVSMTSTGLISGTPTAASSASVSVTCSASGCNSAVIVVNFSITAAASSIPFTGHYDEDPYSYSASCTFAATSETKTIGGATYIIYEGTFTKTYDDSGDTDTGTWYIYPVLSPDGTYMYWAICTNKNETTFLNAVAYFNGAEGNVGPLASATSASDEGAGNWDTFSLVVS